MTQARALRAVDYIALKTSARRLVKAAGGVESAAQATRVGHAQLGRYGDQKSQENMAVDVVADLESDVGAPIVTRALATLSGHLLIPIPPAVGDAEWIGHLGALGKEFGEAMSKLSEAFRNGGTITAEESREMELRREVNEAMEALAKIAKALEALEAAEEKG